MCDALRGARSSHPPNNKVRYKKGAVGLKQLLPAAERGQKTGM